jgi:hypothetical protein
MLPELAAAIRGEALCSELVTVTLQANDEAEKDNARATVFISESSTATGHCHATIISGTSHGLHGNQRPVYHLAP